MHSKKTKYYQSYHFAFSGHIIFHFSQTFADLAVGSNEISDEAVKYLAKVLQKNEVTSISDSTFCQIDNPFIFKDIDKTRPRKQQNLLPRSRIPCKCSTTKQSNIDILPGCFFSHVLSFSLRQTLRTLELQGNGINHQGAEYLGTALQQNKVAQKFSIFMVFNYWYYTLHRHLQHSALMVTKLVLKEQSIFQMRSSKIQ